MKEKKRAWEGATKGRTTECVCADELSMAITAFSTPKRKKASLRGMNTSAHEA